MTTIASAVIWNGVVAAVLASMLLVLSRLSPLIRRPALRHALWLLVLAKLVSPPLLSVPIQQPKLFDLSYNSKVRGVAETGLVAAARAPGQEHVQGLSLPGHAAQIDGPDMQMGSLDQVQMMHAEKAHWIEYLVPAAMFSSIAGSCALAGLTVRRGRRLARLLRDAPAGSEGLRHEAARIARQMGLSTGPDIRLVDAHTSPMLWVSKRGPVIVLPRGLLTQLSDEQVSAILAHEIAHYARRDHLVNWFVFTICLLHWWHPVAWIGRRQVREAQDECCDSLVLANGATQARCYAQTLLAVLDFYADRQAVTPLVSSSFGRGFSLRRRFEMLRQRKVIHRLSWTARTLLSGLVLLLLCTPGWADNVDAPFLNDPPGKVAAAKANGDDKATAEEPKQTRAPSGEERPAPTVKMHPINITGNAYDADGEPIAGATIYLSSQPVYSSAVTLLVGTDRIAETTTDTSGQYSFRMVELPVGYPDTKSGRPHGAFIVFGKAKGRGFAWRPRKGFYPQRDGDTRMGDQELPSRYFADEKIELDLRFAKSANVHGRIVDSAGAPIRNAKIEVWDAERIPDGGYGPQRRFDIVDTNRFELLNAGVPASMWVFGTDAKGRFELTDLPENCRFRINVKPPGFPSRMIWIATQLGLAEQYEGATLYNSKNDINLMFGVTKNVAIRVLYADNKKPAPKVWVEAGSGEGNTFKTTDEEGRVSLALPPGQYELNLLPAYRTAYVQTDSKLEVADDLPRDRAGRPLEKVVELRAGVRVEVKVVDEKTGEGLSGVDLWAETAWGGKELHYHESWEQSTGIVHRDRQRTDEKGVVHEVFEPGKHRIGVARESFPKGYLPSEKNGLEINCELGKPLTVTFHLRRKN